MKRMMARADRWVLVILSSGLLIGMLATSPGYVGADELDQPSMVLLPDPSEHLDGVQLELAQLRARIEQLEASFPATPASCSLCNHCPPQRRWQVAFEFVSVRPRMEDSLELDTDGAAIDYELRLTPRVWVTWQSPSGFGLRGRYWQHHRESNPSPDAEQFNERFGTAVLTY